MVNYEFMFASHLLLRSSLLSLHSSLFRLSWQQLALQSHLAGFRLLMNFSYPVHGRLLEKSGEILTVELVWVNMSVCGDGGID